MSYTNKMLKITRYGIENNYVLIGIILLISCFLMPAFTIISLMNNSFSNMDENNAQIVIQVYGTILAYFEGFTLPLGLFGYIHKRRECDFYNAMPVKRSQYFFGYVLTGIVVFLISFGFTFAVHFVILGFNNIFTCFLQPIAMFFVIYCSMILAVCFSGSVMSALVTFVIRNCMPVSFLMMPVIIAGLDANSYWNAFENTIFSLTPVTAMGVWAAQRNNGDTKWYGIMLFQVLIGAVELFIAFLLHNRRRSESTMAIAFPKSRYPFQYIVMLIAALLTDALLSQSFFYSFYWKREIEQIFDFTDKNFCLFILWTLFVILIVFIFLNIILEKSGRAAFSKVRHYFIFSVCYILALFALFDYIAPKLPYEILSFRPTCAVICVNNLTVTKHEKEDDLLSNDYYYDYDENGNPIVAEAAQKNGDEYMITSSSVIREAYCIVDKKKLRELVDLILTKHSSDDDFYVSEEYLISFPSVKNEEELRSVKMFTVYLMGGDVPYIVEGMSIYNFSNLVDPDYCEVRRCFVKSDALLDQFKEVEITAGMFLANNSEFYVYIPYDDELSSVDTSGEHLPSAVTSAGGIG